MHKFIQAGFFLLSAFMPLIDAAAAVKMPTADSIRLNPPFAITRYEVKIEPGIETQSIQGQVTISVISRIENLRQLELSAGTLNFDSVLEKGLPLRFEKIGSRLNISLPPPAATAPLAGFVEPRTIDIRYHGRPMIGMTFLPDAREVYTAFSTSQWMPCIDAPNQRATLKISLVVDADLKVAANGQRLAERLLPSGKILSEWEQDDAIPSYLFGFAIGPFREVIDTAKKPYLRYLAPMRFSEIELSKIFRDTRDMIAFYESKAGIAYPGSQYTQVLLSGRAAQEMSGFSVMGESYGKRVLADEKNVWLAAHELSHQWWGNTVTNRDWNEFWLNEGIATFMNAAFFEHRNGRDEYLEHINAAKTKYEKIRAAGDDKSLRFPNWDSPTANDRSLVYDKGAYVVHQLRELLGDDLFWAGIKRYTRKHWGSSVTTGDFKQAMEETSGKDLSAFFDEWVYISKR